MDPMVSFLAGWLMASVHAKGGDCMKIVEVVPDAPDGFVVRLASGLNLRVKVSEEQP